MSGKRKVDEESEEEFDDSEEETKITKKSKSVAEKNGEFVFDLGSKKRVTVSKFKGKTLVNIREFYEVKNTGEMKVGFTDTNSILNRL
jgi:hypothetical protein